MELRKDGTMNRKDFQGEISSKLLEEGEELLIDFEKLRKIAQGQEAVVPVVVQDASQVLVTSEIWPIVQQVLLLTNCQPCQWTY